MGQQTLLRITQSWQTSIKGRTPLAVPSWVSPGLLQHLIKEHYTIYLEDCTRGNVCGCFVGVFFMQLSGSKPQAALSDEVPWWLLKRAQKYLGKELRSTCWCKLRIPDWALNSRCTSQLPFYGFLSLRVHFLLPSEFELSLHQQQSGLETVWKNTECCKTDKIRAASQKANSSSIHRGETERSKDPASTKQAVAEPATRPRFLQISGCRHTKQGWQPPRLPSPCWAEGLCTARDVLSPGCPCDVLPGGTSVAGAAAEGAFHLFWAEMGTVGIGGSFSRQFTPSFSCRALVILEEMAGGCSVCWLDGPLARQQGHFINWLIPRTASLH